MRLGSFSLGRGARAAVALVLGWACAACAPAVRVKTAADPAADLSRFETFAMVLPNRPLPSKNTKIDPFVLQRLRQLTYLGLKARGFRPTKRSQADLVVAVEAAEDIRVEVYPSRAFLYDPWLGYGPGVWRTDVSRTREAIVVIDLIDRGEQAVVWRGTGVREIEPRIDEKQLRQIVDAILQKAPAAGSSRAAGTLRAR